MELKLHVFADIIGANIFITRYANQDERWIAMFERCETKDHPDSSILSSEYGSGVNAASALEDYTSKIRGKYLVFNASGDNRKEYFVPNYLNL